MLISKEAVVKWNAKNKKHYCDRGYMFTNMKDPLIVKIEDLTKGSSAILTVQCDYCKKEYHVTWDHYIIMNQNGLSKDCCKECCEEKAKEVIKNKYGGYAELYRSSNNKRTHTNLIRYGAENVFASKIVKEKIVKSNLEKYGVPYTQQCKEVRDKTIATCKERYGVEHYVELFKGKFIGENSPVWKNEVEYCRAERATHEYKEWRKCVFRRDDYTCCRCGARNGNGVEVELHAHHKENWKDNKALRYDVENGITFCSHCHITFHRIYGKRNNTCEQVEEFIRLSDEKIC